MTSATPPDERGEYLIGRVYATDLSYRVVVPGAEPPASAPITCRWDWRFLDTATIEVLLGVSVGPSHERLEETKASCVAVFSIPPGIANTTLRRFVRTEAPRLLLPYLLETLSALTSRGYYGAIVLGPFDVSALIPQAEDDATGVRQIATSPVFAEVEARLHGAEARQAGI